MDSSSFLDGLQGLAARSVGVLPDRAHDFIAHILNNKQHPELDPSIRTLLALRRLARRRAAQADVSPTLARARLRHEISKIVPHLTPVGFVEDLTFAGADGVLNARRYVPAEASTEHLQPLLVFVHGGSFSVGDVDTHDEPCRLLCKYGKMQVLSVDYRLAPEFPFPAAFYDCLAAFRWAHANAQQWGVNPQLIAIGGDSAGGCLSAAVSSSFANTAEAAAAQLLIYPCIDFYMPTFSKHKYRHGLTLTYEDLQAAYYQYNPNSAYAPDDPRLAPLNADNLEHLPPTLVVTASLDVLRDEAEIYAKRLSGLGVYTLLRRVIRQPHGFINMTGVNMGAKRAMIQMAQDFRLLLARVEANALLNAAQTERYEQNSLVG